MTAVPPFSAGRPPPQWGDCPSCGFSHDMVRVKVYNAGAPVRPGDPAERPLYRIPECGCIIDGRVFALVPRTVLTYSWVPSTP